MCSCLFTLFGGQFDHIVNPQDGNGSLSGEFDGVDLRDHRLQHSCSQVVAALALQQVQTAVFEIETGRVLLIGLLGSSVQGTQFGDKLSCVLSSVNGEGLGDDIEGLAELRNSDLFLSVERTSELFKVDAVGDIDCSSSRDDLA
jgi:hypothetical protein